jgi:hypothetical protein
MLRCRRRKEREKERGGVAALVGMVVEVVFVFG